MIEINLFTKQKVSHRLRKWAYGYQGGRDGEGVGKGHRHTLLYSKWTMNRDLLYSTWNSAQCYVPAWMFVAGSLLCSPETTTMLVICYTPILDKMFKVWKKNQASRFLSSVDTCTSFWPETKAKTMSLPVPARLSGGTTLACGPPSQECHPCWS